MRVERLADEAKRTREKLSDLISVAEEEERPLTEEQTTQATKYRQQIQDFEEEIEVLATDLEREQGSRDVSALLRSDDEGDGGDGGKTKHRRYATPRSDGPVVYRSFAEYAIDRIVVDYPQYVTVPNAAAMREEANERLQRTVQNTTSAGVAGLIVPTHMTQILDIIDASRPVVSSARAVPLDRGTMTYPSIGTRPVVSLQSTEKTEAGTTAIGVAQNTLTASTYLGAQDISWQAVNWSNPDVISLWVELAAEAYARQTEGVACESLETSAIGTVGTAQGRLGTAGTESFAQWRSAVAAGINLINTATSSRHRTNTLYLAPNRFYQLATLGTDAVAQMSPIGNVDMGSMSGSFFGLNVVGSYGFDQDTAIVGDAGALLVGENPGSPVDLRVVEPNIGGYMFGIIGAFAAVAFDVNRFYHLGTHL